MRTKELKSLVTAKTATLITKSPFGDVYCCIYTHHLILGMNINMCRAQNPFSADLHGRLLLLVSEDGNACGYTNDLFLSPEECHPKGMEERRTLDD